MQNLKWSVLYFHIQRKRFKFMKDQGYQDEVDLIVRDERRNKFIVDLTKHLNGNTLVLFQFVEKHGDVLHAMINKSLDNRKVFYVYGGTDTQTREDIRAITEKRGCGHRCVLWYFFYWYQYS